VPVEDINKTIEKETPRLASLKNFFPKSRNELYAFIALVIAIISLILGRLEQNNPPKIEVNQVLNVIYQ